MRNIALNFSRKTKSTFGLDTIALVSVRIYVYICTATCWNVTASGRNVLNKAFIWIPASFCFFRILTKAGLEYTPLYTALYRGEQLGSLSETNSKCSPPVFRICEKISQFLAKDKNELGPCLVRLAAVRSRQCIRFWRQKDVMLFYPTCLFELLLGVMKEKERKRWDVV